MGVSFWIAVGGTARQGVWVWNQQVDVMAGGGLIKLRNLMVAVCLAHGVGAVAAAEPNLLPNGNFEGKQPLAGWVTTFPDEAFYKDNGPYVKMAPAAEAGGRRAVMLDLPAGIAGNQGGKIESVPVPVVAGASYRIEVDCMTWDFGAKIHAEAWAVDPNPDQKRTIFRRKPMDGRPALIMCYRAQVPSPPSAAKTWSTAQRAFKVPEKVLVAGKDQVPQFITVKVVTYAATMNAGKSYFTNFRLTRVGADSADKAARTNP